MPYFVIRKMILIVIGVLHLDQLVAVTEINGYQAGLLHVGVFPDGGFLHQTILGGHEEVLAFLVLFDRNDRGNLLARLQGQEIDNSGSAGGSAGLGNLVAFQAVHLTGVRKEHDVMVSGGHHQILDVILIDGLHALDTLAAAVLALEIVGGHTLNVP